jgi:hypothetical protein
VIFLRKRLTLAAFLAILLAASISAAVFAQTPTPPPTTSSNVVTYTNGANVNLQLPAGNSSHPVNLRIIVTAVDPKSDYGGPSVMQIFLWVPSLNQYVGVAILSTNTDPNAIAWIKGVINGTPIWTPPALMNYFVPPADQLQVYMDGDVLWANLTASFNVTLPAALGGNFTIPPMTLMFSPIGAPFAHDETMVFPKPQFSGWTVQMSHTDVPAWVRVVIPMWIPNAPIEVVGTLSLDGTAIYIPPST